MKRTTLIAALAVVLAAPAQADGVRHVEGAWPTSVVAADQPATSWTIAPAWRVTASWWSCSSRAWTRVWPPASAVSDSVVTIEGGDVHRQTVAPGADLLLLQAVQGDITTEVSWR